MSLRRVSAAVALLSVITFAPSLARAAEPDEAALKQKLKKLEDENEELREKLSKAKQDTRKLFDEATRAEKGAGIDFRRPTAVVSQTTNPATPPVGQPGTQHALVRFDEAELDMKISFSAARTVRTWRVHDATCEVSKRNR